MIVWKSITKHTFIYQKFNKNHSALTRFKTTNMQKLKHFIVGALLAIMFLALTTLLSCCGSSIENTSYKVGDIIYLKPDTLQAVVIDNTSMSGKRLVISFRNDRSENQNAYVEEEEIFKEFTNRPKPIHY